MQMLIIFILIVLLLLELNNNVKSYSFKRVIISKRGSLTLFNTNNDNINNIEGTSFFLNTNFR